MARSAGNAGASPRQRAIRRPCSGAAWVQPRGCKGRSPLHKNNLKFPPSPEGKGVGGMGERKHTKGRVRRATKKASPPPGTTAACRDNRRVFSTETGASRGSLNDSFGKSSEGFGGLFQESPGVFLFAPPKKLAISGRMCYNKCTSGAAGTGGASSRKAEGKEEPS